MKNNNLQAAVFIAFGIAMLAFHSCGGVNKESSDIKPNILWVIIEDASCHISCYGETAIQTPNIDALAMESVRFENAFVTAPVCSPARSAMVTGMYQTSNCALNHRSQVYKGKGGGNEEYYESYKLDEEIPFALSLFREAGYFTCNGNINDNAGKEDYNFMANDSYMGISWQDAPEGIPFFSQIQLKGGKNRSHTANTENFKLPPYYFEDEIIREDWKTYLGSWLDTDQDVKKIVSDLQEAGVYDNTLIFLITDHGISHLRGKQFLYDEGIKIPMIVKFPKNKLMGTVRHDLVKHIDILASSLAYAGIPVPENMQGTDLFAEDYEEQEYIISARDRCDETTETIRSVRTNQYKYIRNFLSYRPHAQRNQYKDGKEISKHTRELFSKGKLNDLQASFYQPTRPVEELYDIEKDPFEIHNLADDPDYNSELTHLRSTLYEWMNETNDAGLIPEPILEDLGKKYGNKFTALKHDDNKGINERLIKIIEAGESGNTSLLLDKTGSKDPSERYWAATWLGVNKEKSAHERILELTSDADPSVRIAANLALYKIDPGFDPIPTLGTELGNKNLIVGMYAMNAIEQTGIHNDAVKAIAVTASNSSYHFTQRFGNYLR